jgi:hypothetical protein
MTILEPCLPVRTCSNCKSWGLLSSFTGGATIEYVENTDTGLIGAICQVHHQLRSGGQTCSSFQRKPFELSK